ncbi:hypothetical protein TNCV_2624531 [Trichonephila clavipes]|nr:hypothetical protein TNCV_2624531 [Trichonephila clavipes]
MLRWSWNHFWLIYTGTVWPTPRMKIPLLDFISLHLVVTFSITSSPSHPCECQHFNIYEERFVPGTFRSERMRVLYRSRQNDRHRVMLVLVHIDITPPHIYSSLFAYTRSLELVRKNCHSGPKESQEGN